jgi:hypothetical protein
MNWVIVQVWWYQAQSGWLMMQHTVLLWMVVRVMSLGEWLADVGHDVHWQHEELKQSLLALEKRIDD